MEKQLLVLATLLVLLMPSALAHEVENEGFFERGGHFFSDFFGGMGMMFSNSGNGGSSSNSGAGNGPINFEVSSGSSEELKIGADSADGATEVKTELEFSTSSMDKDMIINEIMSKLEQLSAEQVDMLLSVDNDAEELENRLEVKTREQNGMTEVKFEFRFPLNTDNRGMVVEGIVDELKGLTEEELAAAFNMEVRERAEEAEDFEDNNGSGSNGMNSGSGSLNSGRDEEEEFERENEDISIDGFTEIEVKLFDDVSKVEIKKEDQTEEEFFISTTDLDAIISEVSSRTGLSASEINQLLDVEQELGRENENQMEDNSGSSNTGNGEFENEMGDNRGINSGQGNVMEDENEFEEHGNSGSNGNGGSNSGSSDGNSGSGSNSGMNY